MSGYTAMDDDAWEILHDLVQARYASEEWPEPIARLYLRTLLGERRTGKRKAAEWPTVRELAETWNWRTPKGEPARDRVAVYLSRTCVVEVGGHEETILHWQDPGRTASLEWLRGDRLLGVNREGARRKGDGGPTEARREADGDPTAGTGEPAFSGRPPDGGPTEARREADGDPTPCARSPRALPPATDPPTTLNTPPPPAAGGNAAPAAEGVSREGPCTEPSAPTTPTTTTGVVPPAEPPTTRSVETSTSTALSLPLSTSPSPELPPWVPRPRDCGGHPREAVRDLVVAAVVAVRGLKPPEVRLLKCGTSAGPVLALWRKLGLPPPAEFAEDLVLVIRWAQLAPDHLAENDIRGLRRTGERWGADRSRDLKTLCVQERWDARLDAARRWHDTGAREAAPPPMDAGAEEAWQLCERLVSSVTRSDPIPTGRDEREAQILRTFAVHVRWDRWFNRTAQNRGEARERFLAGWTAEPAPLQLVESR